MCYESDGGQRAHPHWCTTGNTINILVRHLNVLLNGTGIYFVAHYLHGICIASGFRH